MEEKKNIFPYSLGKFTFLNFLLNIFIFLTSILSGKNNTAYSESKYRIILFTVFNIIFSSLLFSQQLPEKIFTLDHQADTSLILNKNLRSSNILRPFTKNTSPVYGLTFTGKIRLNSDTSLVRIILVDNDYKEYLVYETYSLLENNKQFEVLNTGEETVHLNGIIPFMLKIEVSDAEVILSKLEISTKTLKSTSYSRNEILHLQQMKIIDKINRNIKMKGLTWRAGETSVSRMTYQEKKEYFGGRVPNLQGFEYYTGGIYVVPGTKLTGSTNTNNADYQTESTENNSPYASAFSWTNKDGQNWMTPVKNQGGCGSCWAFAAAGATELLINLYFNRHLDMDLSEQNLISGTNGNCDDGGYVDEALNYIKNTGIVNESCFPYQGKDVPITDMCSEPDELIKIGRYSGMIARSEDELKKAIIKSPVALVIESWSHAVTLAGYKTIENNDIIYTRNDGKDSVSSVMTGNPLIGKTAWLIKNSWGTNWGESGYAYIVTSISDLKWSEAVYGPVSSKNFSDTSISCTDNDGDGYYTWGIGPKPAYCPPCPDEPDGDDSDPCLGPMDAYGNITSITPSPSATNILVQDGEEVPDLVASGTNVKWYGDASLSNLLDTGNIFKTGQTEGCQHIYYVTQTINGCASAPTTVELSILNNVTPPVTKDVTACEGDSVPKLIATGENIRWYDDVELSHLIYEGDSLTPGKISPGTYVYYATQAINNCESVPQQTYLTIDSLPQIDIGKDTTVISGQVLTLSVNDIYTSYKWSNGSELSYTELRTGNLKSNFQLLTLRVTDNNGCENNDSVKIYLESPSNINEYNKDLAVILYPNPNNGVFNINYNAGNPGETIEIALINPEGKVCFTNKSVVSGNEDAIHLNIPELASGIYLVRINLNNKTLTERMVVN